MKLLKVKPKSETFPNIHPTCATIRIIEEGMQNNKSVFENIFSSNGVVVNVLIDMYEKWIYTLLNGFTRFEYEIQFYMSYNLYWLLWCLWYFRLQVVDYGVNRLWELNNVKKYLYCSFTLCFIYFFLYLIFFFFVVTYIFDVFCKAF